MTLVTVAEKAQVSKSAVSDILNGKNTDRYRAETVERVLASAKAIGYRPHSTASMLRAKRTYMVGIFSANPLGSCSAMMTNVLVQELKRHAPYKPMFVDPAVLREGGGAAFGFELLEGLFWALPRQDDDLLQSLLTQPGNKLQIVTIGHQYPQDLPLSRVEVGLGEGSYQATEHLLKLGHKRIAILFHRAPRQQHDRFSGYRRALTAHGLTPDPSLCLEMPEEAGVDSYFRAGLNLTKQLLTDVAEAPTGIVCHNDEVAAGVLTGARQLGLVVPDDLSVVGFDGVPLAEYTSPPLTTIIQPVEQQAVAVELMLARLNAGKEAKDETRKLACTLRIGESTAPPKQR